MVSDLSVGFGPKVFVVAYLKLPVCTADEVVALALSGYLPHTIDSLHLEANLAEEVV